MMVAEDKWWKDVEGRNFDNIPDVKPAKKDDLYHFRGMNFKQYIKQVQ